MLLAIDIGNTNIVVALFEETPDSAGKKSAADGAQGKILHEWRIYTDSRRTGDEYFSILKSFFRDSGLTAGDITSAVISSVVPTLIGPFISACTMATGKKPVVIAPDMYYRLPITIPESAVHEIGTDLLCNAVEAWCRCKSPCIVVDFGTALTFTVVGPQAEIEGVAITPGLGTALKSLFTNTAQLPEVPLVAPTTSLGTNTTQSIQAGIVLGYKGLVESLIARIKSDLSAKTGCSESDIHVVATGGLNSVLSPITSVFEHVDKDLTLQGLRRVALFAAE